MLGVSVDMNDANKAWAEKMGVTYPVLSDARRQMTKAYGVLRDDPKIVREPPADYGLLARPTCLVRDRQQGVIRYTKTTEPRQWQPPNDEMLKVLSELK